MNPDEPEANETTPEEEEWQLYATAGYAAAEDPWDDLQFADRLVDFHRHVSCLFHCSMVAEGLMFIS